MLNIKKLLTAILKTESVVPTKVGNTWDSGSIVAYRIGGVVMLKFAGAHINSISARTTIATLPEGYRPPSEVTGKPDGTIYIIVGTGGSIQLEANGGGTFYSTLTYVANLGGVINYLKNAISNLYREGVAVC